MGGNTVCILAEKIVPTK